MTAVLSRADLFLDRPAVTGDRVHCSPASGMPFIARVVGPARHDHRVLQVQRVDNLDYVHVLPASVRVFAAVEA